MATRPMGLGLPFHKVEPEKQKTMETKKGDFKRTNIRIRTNEIMSTLAT